MLDQSKEIKLCTYLGLTTLILSVALVGVVVVAVEVHLTRLTPLTLS
jgi:hypothetical protein